jgi:FkbM family methyltransferase
MKIIKLLSFFKNDVINLLRGHFTPSTILAMYVSKMGVLKPVIMGNIAIKLPDNIRIFVNDGATLGINIPDLYVRMEYMRHPDYIPSENWVVFDIGAHVGVYALWVSKKLGDGGFVVAFEPNPLVFRWLVSNIELNKVRNIKALPYALGDEVTNSILYMANGNVGASSLIKNLITKSGLSIVSSFKVPVLTLDYVTQKSATIIGRFIDHIDLVKIDVEGYEMKVLRGAEIILNRDLIERFVIEVHTEHVSTKELIKFLREYGYILDEIVRFSHKDVVYLRRQD